MTRFAADAVYDAALEHIKDNCDLQTFCVGAPATYAEAVNGPGSSGKMLVARAMLSTDFAIADHPSGGRGLTVAAKTDSVSNAGIGNHVALVDTVNSVLLWVTEAGEQEVVVGRPFEFPSWVIRIPDPEAP
jgi:hypothetical protein